MTHESRSEHCSLMSKPGEPPKPAERPIDCPKDAAYINLVSTGVKFDVPGGAPFPLVVEGGDGNDQITLLGPGRKSVLIDGGKGNDVITVHDEGAAPTAAPFQPPTLRKTATATPVARSNETAPAATFEVVAILFICALFAVFGTVALLGWRALSRSPQDNRQR